MEVLYHRVLGPRGETVLDPVFAELLFVARWRRLPIRFLPSAYSEVVALGELPAALANGTDCGTACAASSAACGTTCGCGRRVVARPALLAAAASLDACGAYGQVLSADDRAFCDLTRHRMGEGIASVIWCDASVWEEFTLPALTRSSPWGFGWLLALLARRQKLRRHRCAGGAATLEQRCAVALLELESALRALAERLGGADAYDVRSGDQSLEPRGLTALDACAFAHLAVLYSIPCHKDSTLHGMLAGFPMLAHYCDRMEMRFGVWPNPRSFLAALRHSERLPAAVSALPEPSHQQALDGLTWWEAWGWSVGGRRRPASVQARKQAAPPWRQCVTFGIAGALSVSFAALLGWGPPPLPRLTEALLLALRGALRGAGALEATTTATASPGAGES